MGLALTDGNGHRRRGTAADNVIQDKQDKDV